MSEETNTIASEQTIVNNKLEFYMERTDGDIDIIPIMVELLSKRGMPNYRIDIFLNDPDISMAKTKPSNVQRWLINKFWRYQLLLVDKNTIDERYALTDDSELDVWFSLFERNILPTLMHFGLPKKS